MDKVPEPHGPQPILLQSKDHGELLDVIDILRSQGISRYISLPQLIVCGDQSSGKSSVLEAVSGVRFPSKDNLCTRFATELILRRDREESVKVTAIPGAKRTEIEKKKLQKLPASIASMDEMPVLIRRAEEAMGLGVDTKAFSDDVLRVEVSGPRQPHLTLVDLPGLIHAENRQQSAGDVELVSSLVRTYMANARSIILAVVSAKNDYANQIVTKLAREVDPRGLRTLGIITKPDTLHPGSESEKAFLDLAKNEDVFFGLGWHLLKNRDYTSRECSLEERNKAEKNFFSYGIWTSLPPNSLGVETLKPRLSTVLKDQIIQELPELINDLETGIRESRSRLTKLGEGRTTLAEQRLYLTRISGSFSSLVKAAVDGVYSHAFFGDAMTAEGKGRRLRATINDLLLDFAEKMRVEGHHQEIVDGSGKHKSGEHGSSLVISRSEYTKTVQERMRNSRGRELPGTYNPLIIGDLFYEQSKPWKQLVDHCCQSILAAVTFCIESIIGYTADEFTKEELLREIIDPAMVGHKERLEKRIAEIMQPHSAGHPITYNHYFTENIQKARQDHTREHQTNRFKAFFGNPSGDLVNSAFSMEEFLNLLPQRSIESMDEFACSEAIDSMLAYYKVAIKVLVDNVAALGIEQCLLSELAEIFSPTVVLEIPEKQLQEIAAETEDALAERKRLQEKLSALEAGLKTLKRLNRHKSAVNEQGHPPPPRPRIPSPSNSNETNTPKRYEDNRYLSPGPSPGSIRRDGSTRDDSSNSPTPPKPTIARANGIFFPKEAPPQPPSPKKESSRSAERSSETDDFGTNYGMFTFDKGHLGNRPKAKTRRPTPKAVEVSDNEAL
ncbi:hypothetical protein MMC07_003190 [Pseudocyphellaria aurata]|nr:hypothetical protein [Pseudocyphellaria aurata]